MEGAIRHLRRAVEIDPDFTSAQMRLAKGFQAIGQDDEGRTILAELNERRAELTEFERLWLDCFLADFDGRRADALAALYSIRELAPSDWTVLHLIGARELRVNRPRRAIAVLEELHGKQLPGFVTRHGLYARSFAYLAESWHIVGDHSAELAAARAGRQRFPTDRLLILAEGTALAALGDVQGLEAVAAAAESTSTVLTHVRLLVLSSATARAHGREELSRELADRSLEVLDRAASDAAGPDAGQLRAQALVLTGRLDQAQEVLAEVLPQVARERSHRPVTARGWLGSVAARGGHLDTARRMDEELAGIHNRHLLGSPSYYRAAIAGWLGHREDSIALLRQARAQGWGAYWVLHDEERVLFEPLEGLAEYQEMLHPGD
jgi:tetratricopeptide (TPR) repeat protein